MRLICHQIRNLLFARVLHNREEFFSFCCEEFLNMPVCVNKGHRLLYRILQCNVYYETMFAEEESPSYRGREKIYSY